jgi:hypothetical protein
MKGEKNHSTKTRREFIRNALQLRQRHSRLSQDMY